MQNDSYDVFMRAWLKCDRAFLVIGHTEVIFDHSTNCLKLKNMISEKKCSVDWRRELARDFEDEQNEFSTIEREVKQHTNENVRQIESTLNDRVPLLPLCSSSSLFYSRLPKSIRIYMKM